MDICNDWLYTICINKTRGGKFESSEEQRHPDSPRNNHDSYCFIARRLQLAGIKLFLFLSLCLNSSTHCSKQGAQSRLMVYIFHAALVNRIHP